jgi:hypothetical protein
MDKRPLAIFALYLLVVLCAAVVLIRTIGKNGVEAERPVPISAAHGSLPCDALVASLTNELFAWYAEAVRDLAAEASRPEPLPGALREWESARAAGAARCANDAIAPKFERLLNVRRGLEGNKFLLATRIGEDVAALH